MGSGTRLDAVWVGLSWEFSGVELYLLLNQSPSLQLKKNCPDKAGKLALIPGGGFSLIQGGKNIRSLPHFPNKPLLHCFPPHNSFKHWTLSLSLSLSLSAGDVGMCMFVRLWAMDSFTIPDIVKLLLPLLFFFVQFIITLGKFAYSDFRARLLFN
jgi:hypothetical protein